MTPEASGAATRVCRVLPDVSGLVKFFDYAVPTKWAETIAIGSLVRVNLHGRQVGGWVTGLDVVPPEGVQLKEITKLSSRGPSQEVIDVASWAAHRYAGRLAPIMKSASPDKMTFTVPPGPQTQGFGKHNALETGPLFKLAADAFSQPGLTVVRVSPTEDPLVFLQAVAQLGDSIVVTASVAEARALGAQVRRSGGRVALAGRDWGLGAAGGMVIGARKAVWATVRQLAGVLILDENDEAMQEERNPTWHAREVAIERARRSNVPCVLVSAAPSVTALQAADRVLTVSRSQERAGWPLVTVVDRRSGDSSQGGLFSTELVELLRSTTGRVLLLLNRKGRAQMLACGSCGELVRSATGDQLMKEVDGQLVARGQGPDEPVETRPLICIRCSGTKLKRLRLGVSRAREELEALAREPVAEVTSDQKSDQVSNARILIGTEALLHRTNQAEAVVFLDFDQELLAPRYRAAEQAMGLIVRAARLTGNRGDTPPGRLLIQTRSPEHRVLRSAVEANPDRLARGEREIRQEAGFPPFGALTEVSGAGAEVFLDPLRGRSDLVVMGPRTDGKYLLRAADPTIMADILADAARPKERVRLVVDPPRA